MTIYSMIVPYLGSAVRVVVVMHNGASGPFVGMFLLAFLFPWANSKGVVAGTLLTTALQFWQMFGKIYYGIRAPMMPVSTDYCPANSTMTIDAMRTSSSAAHSNADVFPLYRFSSNWGVLASAGLTILIGLVVSLLTVLMALGVAQGIYVSCRKRHGHDVSREAFLGDRSLGVLPLAVSVLVSTASPLGLVALTAHFYAYGLHLAWNVLITVAAVRLVVYCVVPVFYRLGVTSVFEASNVKGFPRPAGPTRIFVLINSAVTGPFVGLLVLAILFPFANSKGAGAATCLTIAFQLWHMIGRLRSGILPHRMPVTLDYCPDNTTAGFDTTEYPSNTTDSAGSEDVFMLYRLSSFWSSFFSVIVTIAVGVVISLLTGIP
ncbi:hypothetical protein HPB52_024322 [Rhipicephalus sanguineus]|uniref:Sodium-dependent multivitamin transporter n=1 Tax=Rhipicephalus sanguineus TaxID=34632 RepID=A0A9D4TCF1_RHISA|nr:hypothetical protein HPB52_024322 [Rhipicephalus sanguineus]